MTKLRKRSGFTLIELLIVIGLLGALTALVLPSMMADREEALGNVCDYNQAGTLRVLKQYQQISSGKLPNGLHTGLTSNTAASSADTMPGIPDAQSANLADTASYHALTLPEVRALATLGLTQVAYDDGYQVEQLDTGDVVLKALTTWVDDGGAEFSFYGDTITDINDRGGEVFAFFVAPTVDWESAVGGNSDWGQGNVKVSIDLEGKCPIPSKGVNGEADFTYYMAFVAAYCTGANISTSTTGNASAPAFSPSHFADVAAAETNAEGAVTGDSSLTWQTGAWTDNGDGTYTRIADYDADADPLTTNDRGTVSFTVTDLSVEGNETAQLIGTACPECGVMNP